MLSNVSMKKSDDPSILFEQISVIENKYSRPLVGTTAAKVIDQEDLITVVIQKAPFIYQAINANTQQNKGNAKTMHNF